MKLNEVLLAFDKGVWIRRASWDEEYYLKYDFCSGMVKNQDNYRKDFSYEDVTADDWEFVKTVKEKQLEKLYEILNNFYHTAGIDAKAYKNDLLEVLRMK